jgi:sulfate adenylyltransferase
VPDLESVTDLPTWHPPQAILEFAELVLSGALAARSQPIEARLLEALPVEVAAGSRVVLEDAEGTPVALLERPATGVPLRFASLRPFSHGPARAARRTPAQVRAELLTLGAGQVLAVPVMSPLGTQAVEAVLARAKQSSGLLLWLAVSGSGRSGALPPAALWRAVRGLAVETTGRGVPSIAVPVAIPRAEAAGDGSENDADRTLVEAVTRAYGGSEVLDPDPAPALETGSAPALETDSVPGSNAGLHPIFVQERERAVRLPHRRGVTIFFTGLSGSGKSTVAKALADQLAEHSSRTVSLLDGDEVRRLLSAGLSFSRADRDLNIRRIGFVATEISRHGGLAICAPIAPFAQVRGQVRAAVEEVGDFLLIHVSTPLAECERRDRKGLYAKARQGLIPDFTGISSPYEVPVDADLRLDTSRMRVSEAVDAVWELLSDRGYLAPQQGSALP